MVPTGSRLSWLGPPMREIISPRRHHGDSGVEPRRIASITSPQRASLPLAPRQGVEPQPPLANGPEAGHRERAQDDADEVAQPTGHRGGSRARAAADGWGALGHGTTTSISARPSVIGSRTCPPFSLTPANGVGRTRKGSTPGLSAGHQRTAVEVVRGDPVVRRSVSPRAVPADTTTTWSPSTTGLPPPARWPRTGATGASRSWRRRR